jgi:hypothetical protein
MDWDNIYSNITNQDINNKSLGIDDLTNYTEIQRDNVSNLKIGSHIKYIKNISNKENSTISEKILNGGFLLEIINKDHIVNMVLVLKSNIIWKLRFIKYKIYMKEPNNFNRSKLESTLKITLQKILKDDITQKKIELDNRFKIKDVKNKDYNIIIN